MSRREPVPPDAVAPEFLQRIQDVETVEGSAARFDVRVKGMRAIKHAHKFLLLGSLCKSYLLISVTSTRGEMGAITESFHLIVLLNLG